MNFMNLKSFGSKLNGIYLIKKGIVGGITYYKDKIFLSYVYKQGDFLAIDKFQYEIGIIDYYCFTDVEYEFIEDEELFKRIKEDKEFAKNFYKFLKDYTMEVTAFSREEPEKILYYNLKKIKEYGGILKGIHKDFVNEFKLKPYFDKMIENKKIKLLDQYYCL